MNQTINIHDVQEISTKKTRKLTITDDLKVCREVFSKTFYFVSSNGNEVELTVFGKSKESLELIAR